MSHFSRLFAATSLLLAALSPSLASADVGTSMGAQGQFILSAERMFGFSVASAKFKPDVDNATTTTVTNNSFTLLGISPLTNGGSDLSIPNPYLAPALGIHYTVIPSLTIGGNLGFVHASTDVETKGGNTTKTVDGDPVNVLIFSPKVGYILGLTPSLGLWLRGGLSLYHFWGGSTDDKRTSYSGTGLGLNLDPMLIFSPIDHVGLTIGPNIDLPLTGGLTTKYKPNDNTTVSTDYDLTFRNFGVTAGILAYFLSPSSSHPEPHP